MQATPYFAIMAIPLTLVVITGEIDLSFPSVAALGMVFYAFGFNLTGSVWVAFVLCIGTGLLAGLFNGLIITKIGIPSLVATIATQFLFRGTVFVIRNGTGQSMVPSKETASGHTAGRAGVRQDPHAIHPNHRRRDLYLVLA